MKRSVISSTIVLLVLAAVAFAQETRPFTINDLLKVRRVSDPQLSPKGDLVAFTITDIDVEANRGRTQIYVVPISGGEPRQLTKDQSSSSSPRWSPDGQKLAFISARDGAPQIWTMKTSGGDLKKVTTISTGAGNPVWSPDGKLLAFVSDVYPECKDDECNRKREEERSQSQVKAKIADHLLYRHWNAWKEGKRTHVFVVSAAGGAVRDLTPGDFDSPPFSLGGPTDYAFSPDSTELAFVSKRDKVPATSTNADVFIVSVTGGEPRNITAGNQAWDGSPLYSPDGRYLAYRAQTRPRFEADRFRLMLYDRKTGKAQSISESFDGWVDGFIFSPDSRNIYFASAEGGRHPVYSMPITGGTAKKIIPEGTNDDVKITPDGRTIIFSRNSLTGPVEIFRANVDGSGVTPITRINDALLAPFKLRPAEEISWTGATNSKITGWIVKPTNFDANKKWPLLVLIHGGPQSAWLDAWSYRWNPQIFANAGYVVFMPNPRGSVGFGQQFLDEISGDWAGKVFVDIKNGVAHVLTLGYVDKENIGAAGASYGGYMINWIQGHNDDPRFQFKTLVSHAGVYNLTSMYGGTEELWFPEWEFKGTPWANPELYERWSPHRFVSNFKTPMLVIHGELDYRVPITEGIQLFTSVQRRGVESRLLYFPDEGHWILKPQNSQLWYETVVEWLDRFLK
ncbi:MAG TPA: S9 family peptidase [Pyrinomonadaceae bacterium]|nr:S9 family peptidase [Pyrinomonadaceae bacterium]